MTTFATPLEPSPTYLEWSILMAETMQIDDGKGDYIVINTTDFDPQTMKKFGASEAKAEAKKEPALKKRGKAKKAAE